MFFDVSVTGNEYMTTASTVQTACKPTVKCRPLGLTTPGSQLAHIAMSQDDEKLPLLSSGDERPFKSDQEGQYKSTQPRARNRSSATDPGFKNRYSGSLSGSFKNKNGYSPIPSDTTERSRVTLQKNLTLFHAVVFIVVNVTGTGIFITPTGVTAGVGSVGATLLTWTLCGLYNLSLALCYAELGTAFPVAGGDYVYIQQTVGNLLAFMCLFIYTLMGPVAAAVMSRTFGEYILPSIGLQCNPYLMALMAVVLNSKFTSLHGSKWMYSVWSL